MTTLHRKDFSRGWLPSADAVNCPDNALLRMDNLELDEQGILSLRAGSASVLDINEVPLGLYTAYVGGTRYRITTGFDVAGGDYNWRSNGVLLDTSAVVAGLRSAFGSWLGQVFTGHQGITVRSKKTDGVNISNWGIMPPTPAPTMAVIAADSRVLATCAQAEAPGFVINEGALSWPTGQDGVANGAAMVTPDATTGRGAMTKTFAAETDYSTYTGGQVGSDDDLIDFYIYVTEPSLLKSISLMIDCNSAAVNLFQEDYFSYKIVNGEPIASRIPADEAVEEYVKDIPEPMRTQVRRQILNAWAQARKTNIRIDRPVVNAGWSHMSIPRGSFTRSGSTAGKGWNTVKAVRVVVECIGTGTPVAIDAIQFIGGEQRPLSGSYRYRYCLARPMTSYTALSASSPIGAAIETKNQGVTVTFPADAVRDAQATEIWLYRMGGLLPNWYRVGVKTGVAGVGVFTFDDILSDVDALIVNITLDPANGRPPDDYVMGIAGPYYDRLFVLTTTDLYPSRILNPESFSSEQVIRIAGADEVCYWIKKAFNGLYVGTNKDIYRIEGDGAEYPDGTVNWVKRELNIGTPPVGKAVADEGNFLVFLAADGWRAFNGVSSVPLRGDTDLLWKGFTRHGVSAVNITGAPALNYTAFSACIANGFLYCVTPEGADTTSSVRVWKYDLENRLWYRRVYTYPLCMIYAEPDGTVLAVDTNGEFYNIETGTADGAAAIPVVLWTKVDDDVKPTQRKDSQDYAIRLDTNAVNATVDIHFDGSAVSSITLNAVASAGMGVYQIAVNFAIPFYQVQQRITGNFNTFRLYDYSIFYRERPENREWLENKPEKPSLVLKRFDSMNLVLDTLNAAATITPILDGVAQATYTITTSQPIMNRHIFAAPLEGYDLWCRIEKATGFEFYDFAAGVLDEYPPTVVYWDNKPDKPSHTRKRFGGVTVLLNSKGQNVTVTPVIDGTDQVALAEIFNTTQPLLCFVEIPNDVGKDCWVKCAAATPFYKPYWGEARIIEEFPMAVKGLLPSTNMGWEGDKDIRGIEIKVCTLAAAVTFTPYFDTVADVAKNFAITSHADEPDTAEIVFAAPVKAQDIALSCSGEAEVYSWTPKVSHKYPKKTRYWENKPAQASHSRRRFGGITITIDTDGVATTVTPVLDGIDQAALAVTTTEPLTNFHIVANVVGKDLWAKVTAGAAFYEPDLCEARVVETFPMATRGLHPRTNLGHDGLKVVSGVRIKACTLAVLRTFTAVLDGVNHATTLGLTSGADEPTTDTLNFTSPQSFTDFQISTDGAVELYEVVPVSLYKLPGPRRVWDTGYIDIGRQRITWVREIRIKAKSPANLIVTPYFDDTAFAAYTVTVGALANKFTVFPVPVGREYKGRQPRIVVTCASEFFPEYVEFYFRPSGDRSEKQSMRVKAQ